MPKCISCRSVQTKFTAEILIHFPGRAGLNKQPVWAHPMVMICLKCGYVDFELAEEKIEQLKNGLYPAQSREVESGG